MNWTLDTAVQEIQSFRTAIGDDREKIAGQLQQLSVPAETAEAALAQEFGVESAPTTFFESIALPLMKRGWRVAPCFPEDKQVHTKLVPRPLEQQSSDPTQIHAWAMVEPNANVCVYAEQREGGLLFLDKDGAVNLREKFERETGKPFPNTLLVRSSVIPNTGLSKGHWYFQQTPKTLALAGNIAESKTGGIFSLRVHNQYVASIGSIHPDTGQPYAIVEDYPVAPMPDDLLDWLLKQVVDDQPTGSDNSDRRLLTYGQLHGAYVGEAGRLLQTGYDPDKVPALVLDWLHDNVEENVVIDEKKVLKETKDVAERYKRGSAPETYKLAMGDAVAQEQDVSNWQSYFRSIGEMEDGPIDMIIEGALQEGTCFIGANPSDGKTLVALAFAKAISTGKPLFGLPQFRVPNPRPVIYLIPESGDRAFRKRCEAFRLPDDKSKFMTRTISAGVPLELADPRLMEAVRQTKAVVFLDTASRFMKGSDENAAAQNRQLVNDVVALLAAGAVCVVLLHHATKASKANGERMTLENMLRGTGDFGAMCDQAYGIRKDMTLYANGNGPMEIDLVSLKDREQIGGLTSLRLAASRKTKADESINFPVSYINETGNFHAVSKGENSRRESQMIVAMVKEDPNIPAKDIAEQLGISDYRVKTMLDQNGYHRVKGGSSGASPWHKDDSGSCPYEKIKHRVGRKAKAAEPVALASPGQPEAVEAF